MSEKPSTAAGYRTEEVEQVQATLLTVASALGDLIDELCIVGGLVPGMICDSRVDPSAVLDGAHAGTNDLDVALAVSVLDGEHYKEISARLRSKGFKPDENDQGNKTRQRWRWRDLNITVDFLMPPPPGADADKVRLQNLEADFAALLVKPLVLAFEEPVPRTLDALTLEGDRLKRTVKVCGPAAFIALKAFAFSKRAERKDAYDLTYVLRHWARGIDDIADRMRAHSDRHPDLVVEMLGLLGRDFETIDHAGPAGASRFYDGSLDDDRAADAHGAVVALLAACRQRGCM